MCRVYPFLSCLRSTYGHPSTQEKRKATRLSTYFSMFQIDVLPCSGHKRTPLRFYRMSLRNLSSKTHPMASFLRTLGTVLLIRNLVLCSLFVILVILYSHTPGKIHTRHLIYYHSWCRMPYTQPSNHSSNFIFSSVILSTYSCLT